MYQSTVFSLNDTLAYVVLFTYLYIIGGYIKRFGISIMENYSSGKLSLITLIFFSVFELVIIIGNNLGDKIYFFKPFLFYFCRQNSIFVIILSISVLLGGKILYKEMLKSYLYYDSKYLFAYLFFTCIILMLGASLVELIRIATIEKILLNNNIQASINKLEHYLVREEIDGKKE